MTENAITCFAYRYFPRDIKALFQKITDFIGEFVQKTPGEKFPALLGEIAAATSWKGGSEGPTYIEIEERVQKTAEILKRHGLVEVDAGKFFAAIIILCKFLANQ